MFASILASLAGILVFLFIFWKKLKDDYASEIIFSSASYVLSGILLGYLFSVWFFREYFFWGEFLGAFLGFTVSVARFRLRVFEALEALAISLLPWIAFFFLKDSVVNFSIVSFFGFLFILILVSTYYFLDLNYKNFSWYRSGKAGFSGLVILGMFFLVRSGIAIFFHSVLSFSGSLEAVLSAVPAFASFLLVLNLSRK